MTYQTARLDADQLDRIHRLERDLDVVLVAYRPVPWGRDGRPVTMKPEVYRSRANPAGR